MRNYSGAYISSFRFVKKKEKEKRKITNLEYLHILFFFHL